jgi:catalase
MNLSAAIRQFAALPLSLALVGTVAAQSEPVPPVQKSTPAQLVDAMNGVFGRHADARAIHAKGIVLEGSFTPGKWAPSISKAPHLQHTAVPVTVRFSNFAGIPDIADNHELANPRGLAIKFMLPDGSATDLVTHSFNGFPSATADDFRDLLTALGTSGPGVAKPTPLDTYLGSHPIAKTFVTTPKPAPVSFATLPYYGVNTFKFVAADGKITYGRYQLLPVSGVHYLSAAETAKAAPNYLGDEILQRVRQAPVQFKLVLQVAEKGDKLDDPSIAWPSSRRTIELGTISITKGVADNDAAQKQLLFQPTAVPPGIEPADPMITSRAAAYAVSYGRRHQ